MREPWIDDEDALAQWLSDDDVKIQSEHSDESDVIRKNFISCDPFAGVVAARTEVHCDGGGTTTVGFDDLLGNATFTLVRNGKGKLTGIRFGVRGASEAHLMVECLEWMARTLRTENAYYDTAERRQCHHDE